MGDHSGRNGSAAKRFVTVNAANLRSSHLYLSGALDLFPEDSIGSSSAKDGEGRPVRLDVAGLAEPILTDIPRDRLSGRPRLLFRRRAWVRHFFVANGIQDGDVVAIERTGARRYRIYPARLPDRGRRIRIAEFFAGIGLVRLGLRKLGDVIFANDIDPDKLEMYRDNFGDEEFRLGDIHNVRGDEVPDCDLFTASFPCNDLSIAGAGAGLNGRQSAAYWGFVDVLKDMGDRRPSLVLLENVPGLLKLDDGRHLEEVIRSLNDLGYATDVFVIDALHFVPQSRSRLFIVGKRDAAGEYPFGLEATDSRPRDVARFIARHPEVRWNLCDVPPLPDRNTTLADVVEDLSSDHPAWWSRTRAEYFFNQLSDRHSALARMMIEGEHDVYGTAFRRVRRGRSMAELRADGVAGCLRTPRGGSGRQILFKAGCGKYQVRLLTPRECARLQGAPDSYRIDVPLNKALFGFGDAVCVPVVEWIAANVLTKAYLEVTGRSAATIE